METTNPCAPHLPFLKEALLCRKPDLFSVISMQQAYQRNLAEGSAPGVTSWEANWKMVVELTHLQKSCSYCHCLGPPSSLVLYNLFSCWKAEVITYGYKKVFSLLNIDNFPTLNGDLGGWILLTVMLGSRAQVHWYNALGAKGDTASSSWKVNTVPGIKL